MLIVGLTGGIGSGKTVVSDLLHSYGIPVIDADSIAHQLLDIGSPFLDQILLECSKFCPDKKDLLDERGALRRHMLRPLFFHYPELKKKIEALLHPEIIARIKKRIAEEKRRAAEHAVPYIIISIPLLIEKNRQSLIDRLLVIEAPLFARLARVLKRDGGSYQNVRAIAKAQTSCFVRYAEADDYLVNYKISLNKLAIYVHRLHEFYCHLASYAV